MGKKNNKYNKYPTANQYWEAEQNHQWVKKLEKQVDELKEQVTDDLDYAAHEGCGGHGSQATAKAVAEIKKLKAEIAALKAPKKKGPQPNDGSSSSANDVAIQQAIQQDEADQADKMVQGTMKKNRTADAAYDCMTAAVLRKVNPMIDQLADAAATRGLAASKRDVLRQEIELAIRDGWSVVRKFQKEHPDLAPEATRFMATNASMLKRSCEALSESALMDTVYDSWEDMAADLDNPATTAVTAKVFESILEGVTVNYPFSDKPEMEMSQSHIQLNSTRMVATHHMYYRAAKACKKALERDRTLKPVVVDVGSGGYGASIMHKIRSTQALKGVYLHAMMTRADPDDDKRISRIQQTPEYATWNYVPETHRVFPDRLNYCHHKARDCDCLRHYSDDYRQLVSIHSAYYLDQLDFDNLFKYSPYLEAAVHTPQIGVGIPTQNPEFGWIDATRWGGLWRKAKARVKEFVTATPQVVMLPLRMGCTTYEHPNITPMIQRGGFHVSQLSLLNSRHNDPKWACQTAVTTAAASAVTNFISVGGPLPAKIAAAAVAGVSAGCGSLVGMRLLNKMTMAEQPPPLTKYTVTTHVRNVISLSADKDPLCKVVSFEKHNPRPLRPVCVDHVDVDEQQTGRAAAAMMMGKGEERTYRQVAAAMLRDGVPARIVKGTTANAMRLVNYILDPAPAPNPAPCLQRVVTASISLPCAWGMSKLASLMGVALLKRTLPLFGATADALLPHMTFLGVLLPLIFFTPALLALSWTLGLLLALAE